MFVGPTPLSRSSVASPPDVVILHVEARDGGTILVNDCLSQYQTKRVPRIQREDHFRPQNEISLSIVLIHAVDNRVAAKRVARIQRAQETVEERVADVSFESGQRLLS